jgi:hypothetical protein
VPERKEGEVEIGGEKRLTLAHPPRSAFIFFGVFFFSHAKIGKPFPPSSDSIKTSTIFRKDFLQAQTRK